MTSLLWVSGIRLPSSWMEDPVELVDQHVRRQPARGVVHPCSGERATGRGHGVSQTAGPACEAVADHAAGEHAARVTSRLELAGRGHRFRVPEVAQRSLHALHHRPLGHPVTPPG